MRALALLLSVSLVLPLPGVWAAAPDQGVSPAAAAATSDEGQTLGDRAAADAGDSDLEARLTGVSGPVYVHLADQPEDQYSAAEVDMPVAAGDEIRVGEKGSAELTLEGNTLIQLGEHSDFVVNSLSPQATEFHLGLGSLVAKVKHLLEGRHMEFHTPGAVAAVRGTELGVAQDESGPARVGVFDEGHVAVSGTGKEGTVQIGPNQEAQVSRGQAIGRPAALGYFAPHRERMAQARSRVAQIGQTWKSRPLGQRLKARGALLKRPGLQRGGLRGLSPGQMQRRYGAQRQRQQALRGALQRQRQLNQRRQQQRQQQRPSQKTKAQGRVGPNGRAGVKGRRLQKPKLQKKKAQAPAPRQKTRAFQARRR